MPFLRQFLFSTTQVTHIPGTTRTIAQMIKEIRPEVPKCRFAVNADTVAITTERRSKIKKEKNPFTSSKYSFHILQVIYILMTRNINPGTTNIIARLQGSI